MSKAPVSVSLEQVRRYCCLRQRLGRDRASTVLEVASAIPGLYGTSPTCYLSLAARVSGFRLEDLDRELYDQRALVRMRAMRGSMFVVTAETVAVYHQATAATARRAFTRLIEKCGVSKTEYRAIAQKITLLLEGGERTTAEIRKEISPIADSVKHGLNFIVGLMCGEGLLIRAGVRGGWRSDQYAYARLVDWLPNVRLEAVESAEARALIARQYFESFGPASKQDFAWWSGFSKKDTDTCLRDIVADLRMIEIKGLPSQYLLPEQGLDPLLAETPEPVGEVSLLPAWDAYLMGYKERHRFISADRYGFIYDRSGNSTNVILVDGVASGVWGLQEAGDGAEFRFALFERGRRKLKVELSQLGASLGKLLGISDTLIQEGAAPRSLIDGQAGFQSPLKDVPVRRVN
ncbi:MAG TPA: winged helix DNA-binding domain-containing protein [Blastocatellia bacterium]|nr:winged helix DNA-binding domain-containing protein [Blastocatellia bacterium]